MKTLKGHVILYDAVCPMCRLYTKGFIKAGMLDKDGRLPYQQMPDSFAGIVHQERCVDEIALVNKTTGHVVYGVQSLFCIVGTAVPFLNPLLQNRTFGKIADVLYKFISFNRRVIAPAKKDKVANGLDAPSFHRWYRIAYIIFSWIFTSLVLYKFNFHLTAILLPGCIFREAVICGGQVFWQLAVLYGISRKTAWDYLGNLMTISFAGAIFLLAGMAVAGLAGVSEPMFYLVYFGMVVFLMFMEHIRRTRILGLWWGLTASWVVYRVLVLLILLIWNHA